MKKQGFTLIEISIVLVIIALIAGSIVVGRELIRQFEVRAALAQVENFKTVANTFKLKYGCTPGDCRDAVQKGLGTDSAANGHNGNGDGMLVPQLDSPTNIAARAEFFNFWYHLAQAGLIKDTLSGYSATLAIDPTTNVAQALPRAKVGNSTYIGAMTFNYVPDSFTTAFGNAMFIGSSMAATGTACSGVNICPSGLAAEEAYALDSKIDDGLPGSGMVRELNRGNGNPGSYYYSVFNSTINSANRGCHHNSNIYDVTGAYPGASGPGYPDCAVVFGGAF